MQTTATLKHVHISAQKARLVADQLRGLPAESAIDLLRFSTKKAASIIKKVLDSAIANAEHNDGADVDELNVEKIYVNEGPTAKRFRARARGRSSQILKRTCHITVVVGNDEK